MCEELDLKFSGNVESLSLKPGDALVLTLENKMPVDAVERIRNDLEDFLGSEHPIIVLTGKDRIQKLTKENCVG